MNPNLTDLNILVDRSSSMGSLVSAVRSGIKELIQEQKKQDGSCNLTVAQFDRHMPIVAPNLFKDGLQQNIPTDENTIVDFLCEGVPLDVVDAGVMDGYEPRGSTPLLQAMKEFIDRIGARLRGLPENERPGRVVVVIQTDGEENSSFGVSFSQLKELVTQQEQQYKWQFVFLGANIDAFGAGASLGINMNSTLQYAANDAGVTKAYGSVSRSLTSYRAGHTNTVAFNGTDQESQDDEGARPGIHGVPS